jgi:UDP-glucose 4-epimerase
LSILELAERIKKVTGSDSRIVKIPYDQAYEAGFEDMPRRVPDLSKIRRAVGFEPKVGLDEIIDRVIEYQRSSLKIAAGKV